MSIESGQNIENASLEAEAKMKAFADLGRSMPRERGMGIPKLQYDLPYPKEDFLRFMVENQNVLLHGSSNHDLEQLEPRQANDASKKSGNKNAIYAVTDPVLPIFYAIQDRSKIHGVIHSGSIYDADDDSRTYHFRMPKSTEGTSPWKRGTIYFLDKSLFHREEDDEGQPSGEWTSEVSQRPLAQLEVGPEDFRFLDEVEYGD